jgi:hypothetical protein
MSEFERLLNELKNLERTQLQLTQISQRDDEQRKADVVNLRRQLVVQLGKVSELGHLSFQSPADKDLYNEYRTRLSAMRNAISMHQANFPAVSMDHVPFDYKQSAQNLLKAKEAFTTWAIEIVAKRVRDIR